MPSLNILVVEDHPNTNLVLKRLLELRGHKVTQALTAQAALNAARLKKFDLALLDIALPDGNGWSLFIKLRKIMPELQAIAVTGFELEVNKQTSVDAGFSAHLTKPIDSRALDGEISRLFRGKRDKSAKLARRKAGGLKP